MENTLTILIETLEVFINDLNLSQREMFLYYNMIYKQYNSILEDRANDQIIYQTEQDGKQIFFYCKDYRAYTNSTMIQYYEDRIRDVELRIQKIKERITNVERKIAQLKERET